MTFHCNTLELESGEATNFTSAEISQAFFDLFMNTSISTTDDSTDKLSTGAIVGLVVSISVALIIVVVVITGVSIYSRKHFNYKLK